VASFPPDSPLASTPPVIAIAPVRYPQIVEAVTQAGGVLGSPAEADGLVWTDPESPDQLGLVLVGSPARWVQLPFAGLDSFADMLDTERTWTSAKGIYGPTVAEHALALMLAAARGIHTYVGMSTWSPRELAPVRRLKDSRVLIIGTGGIGRALARQLLPLEAVITAVNRTGEPMPGAASTVPAGLLGEVVGLADWVVLAAPLTTSTRHLINQRMLRTFSRQAWLINVARGGLVDTNALVTSLERGDIAGAALDVTDPEPLPDGHPLWSFGNVIITPHVANTWEMAVPQLAARVERNVLALAGGTPLEGEVDVALGY